MISVVGLNKFVICKSYIINFLQMEGIPPKARTLRMNLVLGKLYHISRHNRAAIACYKDCLRLDKCMLLTAILLDLVTVALFKLLIPIFLYFQPYFHDSFILFYETL